MKIDILSKTTLKLTLTAEDMDDYSLKYENLSAKTAESRRTLCTILRELNSCGEICGGGEDFLTDEKRFFVEAFPRVDGGCLLYISTLFDRSGKKPYFSKQPAAPIFCELSDDNELEKLCKRLEDGKSAGKLSFTSELYISGSVRRLALTPTTACHKHIEAIFEEHGTLLKGELAKACTDEYFELLIPENAAKIVCECF